jgi:glycogen phosphorylase
MQTTETRTDLATWWSQAHGVDGGDLLVAYFSMEFGLEARLPIYSGGLGVLAGDHLKAAAELGIPLVGVGLFYRGGYFTQGLSAEGRQTETYEALDPEALGRVREPVDVEIELAGETVTVAVWRHDVGTGRSTTVPLYLLDVDLLTDALYSGDREHRIRQELLLGVGGVRALAALGIEASVFHVNEGHSAFLAIERARALVEGGASTDDALEHIRRSTIFTTHTPVPAGNEVFGDELVLRYVGDLAAGAGISKDALLALGRTPGTDGFGLTPLALRLSAAANGVSELHGEVAREMWAALWPEDDAQIGFVTNGVHLGTWLAPELAELLRSAGVRPEAPPHEANWQAALELDEDALWNVHTTRKAQLLEMAELEPDRLTIGFARRFATYKRATLMFSDADRLIRILNGAGRPVQIVFAGKAHPKDEPGKHFIQEVNWAARHAGLAGKVVFLEEYDMNVARYMVHGVDVWLNNPRRPYEASGTSGMKASLNGVPNMSVLDGWWAEGYNGKNGWAIGEEQEYANPDEQDQRDVQSFYTLLEQQVVPLFYNRNDKGLPEGWVTLMKEAIVTCAPQFSMARQVKEYTERFYVPGMGAAPDIAAS